MSFEHHFENFILDEPLYYEMYCEPETIRLLKESCSEYFGIIDFLYFQTNSKHDGGRNISDTTDIGGEITTGSRKLKNVKCFTFNRINIKKFNL